LQPLHRHWLRHSRRHIYDQASDTSVWMLCTKQTCIWFWSSTVARTWPVIRCHSDGPWYPLLLLRISHPRKHQDPHQVFLAQFCTGLDPLLWWLWLWLWLWLWWWWWWMSLWWWWWSSSSACPSHKRRSYLSWEHSYNPIHPRCNNKWDRQWCLHWCE